MHSENLTPQSLDTQPPVDTDEQLAALLRTLPREEAGLGFEDRVLRRARQAPTPPLTFARGLRLAAPLMVAAALGFVVGPALLEQGSELERENMSSRVASEQGVSGTFENPSAPAPPSSRPMPVTSRAPTRGQIVANQGVGTAPLRGAQVRGDSSLVQMRAEAARVRRELDSLRRAHAAAGPTVTVMMADGVEVQVDIHELFAALEERAAQMATLERRRVVAAGQGTPERGTGGDGSSSPIEPPLW